MEKNRCPTCGSEIEEVTEGQTNYCPQTFGAQHGPFFPEELIGEDDDYEWCY